MGCIRNADPIFCLLSALAFYFLYRWGRGGALGPSSFRQSEDYYNLFTLPGSIKMPARPLSYHTQVEWNRKMFQAVGTHSKRKDPQRAQARRRVSDANQTGPAAEIRT